MSKTPIKSQDSILLSNASCIKTTIIFVGFVDLELEKNSGFKSYKRISTPDIDSDYIISNL